MNQKNAAAIPHITPADDKSRMGMWTFVAIDADTKLVPAYRVWEA
jgi:hypothetical protein